jgi:hypothetical protein
MTKSLFIFMPSKQSLAPAISAFRNLLRLFVANFPEITDGKPALTGINRAIPE